MEHFLAHPCLKWNYANLVSIRIITTGINNQEKILNDGTIFDIVVRKGQVETSVQQERDADERTRQSDPIQAGNDNAKYDPSVTF